jgi:hypothetical protein
MRRPAARIGVVLVAAVVAASAFAAIAGSSRVAAPDCSLATANQLIDQHGLNSFQLPSPAAQVLCGPFVGAGSVAMVFSIKASNCWTPQGWAVFRYDGASWQQVMVQGLVFVVPPLVAVGSDIKETQPVFRAGDPRCLPSGGTHSRLWHWNGSQLVAGAWTSASPPARTTASFYSPSRNLGCEMDDGRTGVPSQVYCQSLKKPHSVTLRLDGRLRICRNGVRCLGNAGEHTPILHYGRQVTVGRFRCFSLQAGVKCIVTASGRGFLINAAGVTKIG